MEELFIDLSKSLNTSGLVRRPVQVHRGGKVFTRLQWVNPNDQGQPVFHSRKHDEPKPTPKTPQEREEQMKQKNTPENIEPFPAKLGLKHTEHGLPDHEVEKRHGMTGSLDISQLTKGTPLMNMDLSFSKKTIAGNRYTREYADKIDVSKHVGNIFKNITKEGLEHVFSTPDGKFKADLINLDVRINPKTGYVECGIDLEWKDKNGNYAGGTGRSIFRDKNGHLHIMNDIMEIEKKYQGKGLAEHEQERAEQLWRHISDGHPVHLSLEANINVGVYAWANKGYDFENEEEIHNAQVELKDFLKGNNLNVNEVLHNSGYEKIEDLQHSWQFANLDDKNKYNIGDMYAPEAEDLKGVKSVHIGKAFMLGGKTFWEGEKILNGGTEHEEISDAYKKAKSKKKAKKVVEK